MSSFGVFWPLFLWRFYVKIRQIIQVSQTLSGKPLIANGDFLLFWVQYCLLTCLFRFCIGLLQVLSLCMVLGTNQVHIKYTCFNILIAVQDFNGRFFWVNIKHWTKSAGMFHSNKSWLNLHELFHSKKSWQQKNPIKCKTSLTSRRSMLGLGL